MSFILIFSLCTIWFINILLMFFAGYLVRYFIEDNSYSWQETIVILTCVFIMISYFIGLWFYNVATGVII